MKILCFGDSNTYGYDPRSFLGSRYPAQDCWVDILAAENGWEMVNDGMNGREIPRWGISFPGDLDGFVMMLGTNDLLQGRSATETAVRMEAFLAALKQEKKPILLIAPPALALGAWVPEQALVEESKALARGYQALAEKFEIGFADAGQWNVTLTYDGVHFTEDGHRAFARGIKPVLRRIFAEYDGTEDPHC